MVIQLCFLATAVANTTVECRTLKQRDCGGLISVLCFNVDDCFLCLMVRLCVLLYCPHGRVGAIYIIADKDSQLPSWRWWRRGQSKSE